MTFDLSSGTRWVFRNVLVSVRRIRGTEINERPGPPDAVRFDLVTFSPGRKRSHSRPESLRRRGGGAPSDFREYARIYLYRPGPAVFLFPYRRHTGFRHYYAYLSPRQVRRKSDGEKRVRCPTSGSFFRRRRRRASVVRTTVGVFESRGHCAKDDDGLPISTLGPPLDRCLTRFAGLSSTPI